MTPLNLIRVLFRCSALIFLVLPLAKAKGQILPGAGQGFKLKGNQETLISSEAEATLNRNWGFLWHWINDPVNASHRQELMKSAAALGLTYQDKDMIEPKLKRPLVYGNNEKKLDLNDEKASHFINVSLLNGQAQKLFDLSKKVFCLGKEETDPYCYEETVDDARSQIWKDRTESHLKDRLIKTVDEKIADEKVFIRHANQYLIFTEHFGDCKPLQSNKMSDLSAIASSIQIIRDISKKAKASNNSYLQEKGTRFLERTKLLNSEPSVAPSDVTPTVVPSVAPSDIIPKVVPSAVPGLSKLLSKKLNKVAEFYAFQESLSKGLELFLNKKSEGASGLTLNESLKISGLVKRNEGEIFDRLVESMQKVKNLSKKNSKNLETGFSGFSIDQIKSQPNSDQVGKEKLLDIEKLILSEFNAETLKEFTKVYSDYFKHRTEANKIIERIHNSAQGKKIINSYTPLFNRELEGYRKDLESRNLVKNEGGKGLNVFARELPYHHLLTQVEARYPLYLKELASEFIEGEQEEELKSLHLNMDKAVKEMTKDIPAPVPQTPEVLVKQLERNIDLFQKSYLKQKEQIAAHKSNDPLDKDISAIRSKIAAERQRSDFQKLKEKQKELEELERDSTKRNSRVGDQKGILHDEIETLLNNSQPLSPLLEDQALEDWKKLIGNFQKAEVSIKTSDEPMNKVQERMKDLSAAKKVRYGALADTYLQLNGLLNVKTGVLIDVRNKILDIKELEYLLPPGKTQNQPQNKPVVVQKASSRRFSSKVHPSPVLSPVPISAVKSTSSTPPTVVVPAPVPLAVPPIHQPVPLSPSPASLLAAASGVKGDGPTKVYNEAVLLFKGRQKELFKKLTEKYQLEIKSENKKIFIKKETRKNNLLKILEKEKKQKRNVEMKIKSQLIFEKQLHKLMSDKNKMDEKEFNAAYVDLQGKIVKNLENIIQLENDYLGSNVLFDSDIELRKQNLNLP
ncbi:MAG: hypothetical protein ABIQ95_03645 [Bdellovibrionia bacterium]